MRINFFILFGLMAIATAGTVTAGTIPNVQSRIVGGREATEDSFQYQVGLSVSKNNALFWCGGSLIASNWILTAAHCVYYADAVDVILGQHDISSMTTLSKIHLNSSAFYVHPEYNSTITLNDIALIKMIQPIVMTDKIQTVALALELMDQNFLVGKTVTASGWGKTSDMSSGITNYLMFVNIVVMNQTACTNIYASGLITSNNICTDGSTMEATCSGDSGGPLVYEDDIYGKRLVGLTSFGSVSGCQKGYPTAFTRITSYLDWISLTTEIDFNC